MAPSKRPRPRRAKRKHDARSDELVKFVGGFPAAAFELFKSIAASSSASSTVLNSSRLIDWENDPAPGHDGRWSLRGSKVGDIDVRIDPKSIEAAFQDHFFGDYPLSP